MVPEHLKLAARTAGLHVSTYSSLLRPEANDTLWELLSNATSNNNNTTLRLLIVGGGATACELTQSLARLVSPMQGRVVIEVVAPAFLPGEDVTLQAAAIELLTREASVRLHLGRVVDILPDRSVTVRHIGNGTFTLPTVDAALLCLGRSPVASLSSLRLERAGVEWSGSTGIRVHPHTLKSMSARHVAAAGDCCDAVTSRLRTASQAAWTGFHAVRNLKLPSFLLVGDRSSVNANITRVIYTE